MVCLIQFSKRKGLYRSYVPYRAAPSHDMQRSGGLGRCPHGPRARQSYQSKATTVSVDPREHFRLTKPRDNPETNEVCGKCWGNSTKPHGLMGWHITTLPINQQAEIWSCRCILPVIISTLQTDRQVSLIYGGVLSDSAPHLFAIGERNRTEKLAVSPHWRSSAWFFKHLWRQLGWVIPGIPQA